MTEVKDVLHKCKWWFCGAAIVGGSCLYLAHNSKFRSQPQPEPEKMEIFIPPVPQRTAPVEDLADKEKLIGYSMVDAFKYGVINSISDYVDRAPHKTDTIKFAGEFNQVITYGYHQKINGKKYVVLSHIEPDTISVAGASSKLKKMIISFAKYHNDSTKVKTIKAHELWHQASDPDVENGTDINLANKSTRSIFDYNSTTEEFAKICGHDEISSRLNGLLYLREQYLQNGNSRIFKDEYSFYGRAIRSGKIDPNSENAADVENERLFMFKSLIEQWESKHKYNYEDYAIAKLEEHHPMDKGQTSEYDHALDRAYTFIWKTPSGDSKLVNMNYISGEIVPDIRLTDQVEEAALYRQRVEEHNALTKKEPALSMQALKNQGR
uniref:Uncharacterized protein n=1 Tax=uncultured Alphaproteobacteria bacterium TaxID=91750 RepID=A0A6G8F336_9PROT|nr:hypothetical protein PlAlph_4700 [uncultured Alphaproteobacteria bacterium]